MYSCLPARAGVFALHLDPGCTLTLALPAAGGVVPAAPCVYGDNPAANRLADDLRIAYRSLPTVRRTGDV